jgi:uncharacterized protein (DUF983 family)
MGQPSSAAVSSLRIVLLSRCPRCGKGALFKGLLDIRPLCPVCGLDLHEHDTGDGPAFAVVLLLGAIIVGLAIWVEVVFSPPLWVHAVIWPVVTVPSAILLMRPLKAALVMQQYRHRAREMGADGADR